ncbi:hypothetical protein [Kitasatospora terrestris]|uniref:Uncharacterized protein n=1 Tax=Kitasatospora terrestris TaxID=258051 RepID=A0ABP9DIP4_9ACTN
MAREPVYQNITATVRPPRCAIFINKNTQYWTAAAQGAISKASEVWGGRYFIIIPTDGEAISEKYWEILEAYSPDYLAVYNLRFSDLEFIDAKVYQEARGRYEKRWNASGNSARDFPEFFSQSASTSSLDALEISESLQAELLNRLSPFHHSTPIDQHISPDSGFGYPFTKISEIAAYSNREVISVNLPKLYSDPLLSLLVSSQTGGGANYRTSMESQGVAVSQLPDEFDPLDLFMELSGEATYSINQGRRLTPEIPFSASMVHLDQYYRMDRHRSHVEPVVIVLGDTVDDFCLYYSMSRLHEGIIWLPLAWLRGFTATSNERRKCHKAGRNPPEYTDQQTAARRLVNLAFGLIKYGYESKRIQICSMSLTIRQAIAYRSQAASCAGDSKRFISAADCVPVSAVSTTCILRTFEQDNYVNHRSMAFIDAKSVSPFETPRPKNFRAIKLPGHYWLTSLEIEGYQPPALSKLGPKIVNLHNSPNESRVANDGIAYLCPNSMIFSSDLDAVLVRPRIELPDTMSLFNSYFDSAGVRVQYSDKGNYFADTLRRFGGLDETGRFIKDAATRSILDKFMSNKVADKGNVIYVENDQRAYLNLQAISGSLGNEDSAADLVDELIGKQILQRGYIFQCERCRLISWYNIDSLTAEFTCNRCSLRQQFTRSHWRTPATPHWYYKLAETVYQFYRNNSHLTAQVLYKLKAESRTAFHYAPEIDLVNFPRPGKSREMDVACILDGNIIFGECKTQPLQLADIEKFETLLALPVKKPSRIIFATTKEVPERFNAAAKRLPAAEILTRGDLYDD